MALVPLIMNGLMTISERDVERSNGTEAVWTRWVKIGMMLVLAKYASHEMNLVVMGVWMGLALTVVTRDLRRLKTTTRDGIWDDDEDDVIDDESS